MPKVSIVLCSYNGEQYLSEQIESILDQSYKDFELIICDDQSSDNSFNIINDFAKKDARIKAYSNSNNLGYVKNFEKGISFAKGDYIALSDQDDVWALDKIEKLLENIKNHVLIYCNSSFVNSDLKPTGKAMSSKKEMITTDNPLNLCLLNCVSGHALLFKKELTPHLFPFPKLVPHDWWIAFIATIHGGIVYLDEPLIKYRIHQDNALALNKNRKSVENKITKRQVRIREFYNKCPDNHKAKKVLSELNYSYQNMALANKFKKMSIFFKYQEELFIINKKEGFSRTHYIIRQFNKLL